DLVLRAQPVLGHRVGGLRSQLRVRHGVVHDASHLVRRERAVPAEAGPDLRRRGDRGAAAGGGDARRRRLGELGSGRDQGAGPRLHSKLGLRRRQRTPDRVLLARGEHRPMTSVAAWIESTSLSQFIINRSWTWPTLESLHFLGLCVLIGAVLIMDLRLIGFQREIPLRAVHKLMPFALLGFTVNLLTGVMFVFGEPQLYLDNPAFRIKMSLIVLAGLNFVLYYYKRSEERRVGKEGRCGG